MDKTIKIMNGLRYKKYKSLTRLKQLKIMHGLRYKERKQLMLATVEAEKRMRNSGIFIKS